MTPTPPSKRSLGKPPLGCDEFGNGCGCEDCMAEHAENRRQAAEWREALGDELWSRFVAGDGASP